MSPPEPLARCSRGVENKTRIDGIEHEMGQVWGAIQEMRKEIKEALTAALRRPGWAVLVIITILSSLVAGLLVRVAVISCSHQ